MLKRVTVLMAAACVSATALAGTASATNATAGTKEARAGEISWQDCPNDAAAGTSIRCADLSVPADWHEPQGARTSVRLAKIPAQNPEQRRGSLLINLGGNGATAKYMPNYKEELTELTRWFDVIAFDTRGMGGSSGVTCPTAPNNVKLMFSVGEKSWQRFAEKNREWEAACRKAAGPLAGNLNAWQVAHDMEAIRKALGEGGLLYLGNSYGTVLGQAYAELFPGKVDRMFLDSAPNHAAGPLQRSIPRARIAHDKFRRFGEWCETNTDCALYPKNARDVWDKLMAQAREHPLPAPDVGSGKTVGPSELRFKTLNAVDEKSRWPKFAKALSEARAGNASDLYVAPPSTPGGTTVTPLAYCSNFPFDTGWEGMAKLDRQLREVAPRVGWLMGRVQYSRCAGMQHQGSWAPHRIDPEGLPPVLLVNGTRDDNTPPAGGRALAEQLPGSVWFGAETGHAVYLDGNRCARDIVHRYLLTGALPEEGRICPA